MSTQASWSLFVSMSQKVVTCGLRAGDALHLVVALEAKAQSMATLDDVLARNAALMKLPLATI